MRLILGLTGPNAAGKGECAARLSDSGFAVHSLSDIVREEALARGLTTGREDLISTGNLLRLEGGPGVLAERMAPRLGMRDVVDSIRNPAEVEVFRKLPGFHLLGITAPVEVRYERARQRARPGDPTGLEEFVERERQENGTDLHAQRLAATFAMADNVLDNDGGLEKLFGDLDRLVAGLLGRGSR